MKGRVLLSLLLGAAGGLGLSAYQYFGPLNYLGLKAAFGLFATNFLVGIAAALLASRLWPRRRLGRVVTLVVVCAAVAAWGHWNMRQHFNVVIWVADAVRPDHVSAYGYQRETTPNWETLANLDGGVVFKTAVAQGTATTSGGPALLTGLYQSQTGYVEPDYLLPEQVETLPEHLDRLGYITYGLICNPHLSGERGLGQGFSVFEDALHWSQAPNVDGIAREFARWYEAQRALRLFAFLFSTDTHVAYRAPLEDVVLFRPGWRPIEWDFGRSPMASLQGQDQEDVIALYDAAIRSTDRACGRVFETLQRADALDRTLVIITADHGEEFWDHGRTGHGKEPYEHQVRIPLIIRFPSPVRFPAVRPVAHVCDHPAAQVDLIPTILDFLGAPLPSDVMGESLLPYVFGRRPPKPDRALLTQHLRTKYDYLGWRKGNHKLVVTRWRSGQEKVELYDLAADPEEHNDLAAAQPGLVASLRQEMERELARPPNYAQEAERRELSPEAEERLKALGYLD